RRQTFSPCALPRPPLSCRTSPPQQWEIAAAAWVSLVVNDPHLEADSAGSAPRYPVHDRSFLNADTSERMPTIAEIEAYIRQAAMRRGMDPDVAVRVAKSEGLAPGVWQSNVCRNGVREPSYGPFQLLVREGGLGNAFQRATGKSAADPSTALQQVDFA